MSAEPIEIVTEVLYTPRKQQRAIHDQLFGHRFGVVVCHRRMGKTVLAINHLIRAAMLCESEAPRFGYLAPTYRQGKAIAWDYLKRFSAPVEGRGVNESELRVDLENGGQVRIYGADNPDSLRGLYFDGVVMDEYGLFPPTAYSEVIAATLVDRQGWALFLGTPNGKNQFYDIMQHARAQQHKKAPDWFFAEYKASQTNLIPRSELDRAAAVMTDDEYEQEYECSFTAAVKGAIYGKEMGKARAEGRITRVPHDPALPVDTDWDLGIDDSMSIWFSQSLRSGEVRLIDYYEASGEGFPHYVQVLRDRNYNFGKHWAPHDISVRELSSGKSRLEVARSLGLNFEVTPRLNKGAGDELADGIHAVRLLLSMCWFDEEKCGAGLDALTHYRKDYNQRLNEFKATPVHDWASHGADAFRGLAVRHKVPQEKKRQRIREALPIRAFDWS